jgi:predicted translin family RNA/ssDNA-binding protein
MDMSVEEVVARRTSDDARLERIERKIDILSEAMIALARAEEKLISIEKANQTAQTRIDKMNEKIESLEDMVRDNNKTVHIINKVFWIIIAACVTIVTTNML